MFVVQVIVVFLPIALLFVQSTDDFSLVLCQGDQGVAVVHSNVPLLNVNVHKPTVFLVVPLGLLKRFDSFVVFLEGSIADLPVVGFLAVIH